MNPNEMVKKKVKKTAIFFTSLNFNSNVAFGKKQKPDSGYFLHKSRHLKVWNCSFHYLYNGRWGEKKGNGKIER